MLGCNNRDPVNYHDNSGLLCKAYTEFKKCHEGQSSLAGADLSCSPCYQHWIGSLVPFYNFAPVDSPFVLEKSLLTFERCSDDLLGDLLDVNMRTHADP